MTPDGAPVMFITNDDNDADEDVDESCGDVNMEEPNKDVEFEAMNELTLVLRRLFGVFGFFSTVARCLFFL